MVNNDQKNSYTTAEVAKLLGVSRVAIFKQIRSGKIRAKKVGRAYKIKRQDLPSVLQSSLSGPQKQKISRAVDRAFREYGRTLRLLGKE